jgi:hypothetical protein
MPRDDQSRINHINLRLDLAKLTGGLARLYQKWIR